MKKIGSYLKKAILDSGQKGSVLIVIISTIVLLSALTAGVLNLKTTSTYSQLYTNQQKRAYNLAESGGRYAISKINADLTQAINDLHNKEFQLGSSSAKFSIAIDTTTKAPSIIVLSTGIVNEGTSSESKQETTYELEAESVFDYGLFATSTEIKTDKKGNPKAVTVVEIGNAGKGYSGNAYIDYYNSNDGAYTGLPGIYAGNALVAVNRTGADSIVLKENAVAYGDAYIGPEGSTSTDITLEDSAAIKGSKLVASSTRSMESKTDPGGGTAIADIKLENAESQTLTAGTYRLDEIKLEDDSFVDISGDVTLIVADKLEIKDSGAVYIQNGGSLTIYGLTTAGDVTIKIKGKGIIDQNTSPKAENLIIYGDASCKSVEVSLELADGDAKLYGAIYAPESDVTIEKDAQLFGAAVGETVDLEDDTALHFDKALQSLPSSIIYGGSHIQY